MADVRPKEPEQDRVIHEYDGIQEYDNRLPNWWLYTLFGTIVFGFGYWAYYQQLAIGPSPSAEYEAEVAAEKAKLAAAPPVTPDLLAGLAKDPKIVESGKQTFQTTCAACHGPAGGGIIGPNLTDAYWLHGGAPDKIYATVRDGYPAKGMPPWGPALGEDKVRAAVAYVLTIRNTNVPGGKPPQGDEER
jgi:cytochrome c oxidase cbb3-type subunit 3